MPKLITTFVVAAAVLSVCLARAEDKPGITRDNFKSLVLADVQGLSGGRNLYVTKDQLIIQTVNRPTADQRGLQEQRFETKLAEKDFDKLIEMLNTHDFLHIEGSNRPGIPDESRPTMQLTLAGGESKSVAKWGGDKIKDFDPIYLWLLELAKASTRDAKPIAEGNHDYAWRPAGFGIKK